MLQQQIDYLKAENQAQKEKLGGKKLQLTTPTAVGSLFLTSSSGSITSECLDRIVPLGERHLRRAWTTLTTIGPTSTGTFMVAATAENIDCTSLASVVNHRRNSCHTPLHSLSEIAVSTIISPAGFPGDRGTSLRCARRKTCPSSLAPPDRSTWYRSKPTMTSRG